MQKNAGTNDERASVSNQLILTPQLVSLTVSAVGVPCSWYGCFLILGFATLRDTLTRLHSQECHSSAIKETVPEPPGVVGISCKHKPPDGFLWKCATQWYTPKWPSYPSGENNDQPSNSEIPHKKDKPRASQCDSYQVGQQIWASHVSGVCCMHRWWILLPSSPNIWNRSVASTIPLTCS